MIKVKLDTPFEFEGTTYKDYIEVDLDKLTGNDVDRACRNYENSLSPNELLKESFNMPFQSRAFLQYLLALAMNERSDIFKVMPAKTCMALILQAKTWSLSAISDDNGLDDEAEDNELIDDKEDEFVTADLTVSKQK